MYNSHKIQTFKLFTSKPVFMCQNNCPNRRYGDFNEGQQLQSDQIHSKNFTVTVRISSEEP